MEELFTENKMNQISLNEHLYYDLNKFKNSKKIYKQYKDKRKKTNLFNKSKIIKKNFRKKKPKDKILEKKMEKELKLNKS